MIDHVPTMQALTCQEFAPIDAHSVESVAIPVAKPHEVLIKIEAAGVNFPDGLLVQGLYQMRPAFPFTPGAEVCGTVVEVGVEVKHLQPGAKVIGWCMLGGYAEYVAVPSNLVMPIPDTFDAQQAAALMTAHATAHHALKQRGQCQAGDIVLVTGAAGGTGTAAVQIAKQMGATVIAACSTDEKCEFAKAQGADYTINTSTQSIKEQAKAITHGQGVDIVYECVGGDIFNQCVSALGFGGRLLVIGFAGGEIPKFSVNLALVKSIAIVGVYWGSFTQHDYSSFQENMAELMGWFAQGTIQVHIDRVFTLQEANAALRYVASRQVKGKVVLVPK